MAYIKNYDAWKTESPYRDEPEDNDFYLNGCSIFFHNISNCYLCNGAELSLDECLVIIENIDNLKKDFILDGLIYVNVFDMIVKIDDFVEMYEYSKK